jgi:hypothetical protein
LGLGFVGFGYKKLSHIAPGQPLPSSGQIDDSKDRELQTLLNNSILPSQRQRRRRTVKKALMNCAWISDIQRALTIEIIAEYIQLWDLLYEFQLQPDVEDSHIWRLSTDGQYSAKSGYDNLFLSATLFKPCGRIWKSWVPPKCRLFF